MKTKKSLIMLLTMIFIFMIPFSASAKVKLNKTSISLIQGKSTYLQVVGTNKKASWRSSKPSVATIDDNGFLVGYKKGKSDITATISGKKYKCSVTVKSLTPNNVKALTFNELLNLIDKKIISEDKLISLIKADSLSESVVIKLIKKEYITDERVIELIKENMLSQSSILQLIKNNTLSKDDIIELIKSNTLSEDRVCQIAASYSGISRSEVISLIQQYNQTDKITWADGKELTYIDKNYEIGKHIRVNTTYPYPDPYVDTVISHISVKKYKAENDPSCAGLFKYEININGSFNLNDIIRYRQGMEAFREEFPYLTDVPDLSFNIIYLRKDNSSEKSLNYFFENRSQEKVLESNLVFNEETGEFSLKIVQKNMNVDYDNFIFFFN